MSTAELEEVLFRIRPDDVIAAILLHLPSEFKADEEAIHTTITGLADEDPDLFGWFEVTSDYPYPFSRCLENVLHRLGQSRLLDSLNPSFAAYYVDKRAKATIKARYWRKFNKEQKSALEAAARKLAEVTAIDRCEATELK